MTPDHENEYLERHQADEVVKSVRQLSGDGTLIETEYHAFGPPAGTMIYRTRVVYRGKPTRWVESYAMDVPDLRALVEAAPQLITVMQGHRDG